VFYSCGVPDPEWRLLDPRGAITRARHFRVWHRHGERWEEAKAAGTELIVGGERRHRTTYLCRCGARLDGEVPG